jgi:hypothetical protein
MPEVLKCLLCDEPVVRDDEGRVTHLFSGNAECTYRSHL